MQSKWDALDPNANARRKGILEAVFRSLLSFGWHWLVALVLVVAGLTHYGQVYVREWRAQSLKRETRRRYGIPDDDHRPFHVAAQAAATARRQRELEQRDREKKAAAEQRSAQQAQQYSQTSAWAPHPTIQLPQNQSLVARAPYGQLSHREIDGLPPLSSQSSFDSQDWSTRYNPQSYQRIPGLPQQRVSSRSGTARLAAINGSDELRPRKHLGGGPGSLLEEHIIRRAPKRRVDSDSEAIEFGSDRQKRARQYLDLDGDLDEDMDQAASDPISDDGMDTEGPTLPSVTQRSLKRGRSDAGSVVEENIRNRKVRRKGVAGSAPAVPLSRFARGTKRTVDSTSDDDTESPAHKRGRTSSDEDDSDSDMRDEEDAAPSQETETTVEPELEMDISCGNRKVGDTWSEGDVQFKVGPDGRRLRLTPLKEVRTRSVKVKDFSGANPGKVTGTTPTQVSVVVERWLTDEAFAAAKSQKLLAWGYDTDEEGSISYAPDPPPTAKKDLQIVTSATVNGAPSGGGKLLLWDSQSRFSSRPTTPSYSAQTSPTANTSTSKLANPFHALTANVQPNRRISSAAGGMPQPQPRYFRSYSKWEKMEAEAEALEKLRKRDKQNEKPETSPTATATTALAVSAAPPTTPSLFGPKKDDAVAPSAPTAKLAVPTAASAPAPASNPLFAPNPPLSAAAQTDVTVAKSSLAGLSGPANPTPMSLADPKSGFSFGPPTAAPTNAVPAPTTTTATPAFPAFNIPKNPLSMAPGDKPTEASTTPQTFSFTGPTSSVEPKSEASKPAFHFAQPTGTSGSLGGISFGPKPPTSAPVPAPAPAPAFPLPQPSTTVTASTAAPPTSTNLFGFGPSSMNIASSTAAKPSAAPTYNFGPHPATSSGPGSTINGAGSTAKSSPFNFGPGMPGTATSAVAAPANATVASPNSFGPTVSSSSSNPFMTTSAANPFAPPPGGISSGLIAQGRPIAGGRARSTLATKLPLGSSVSPSPTASTASGGGFKFNLPSAASATAGSVGSPFGFGTHSSTPTAGASATTAAPSFGFGATAPAAGAPQPPNPSPFGAPTFQFGQK
ncbi:hypothetical protein BKA62DRAFT_826765 [Auriculariales sp. MPI-PUGE-AT-0066]|nr:hypothetical protein BKA62DRAFT_826765 [Auriculariales sp. MPI-PUGE-AT-0066]